MPRLTRHFALAPVLLLLVACASQPAAPVTEHGSQRNESESGYRVVIPGDTLYSIAWEAGHDYKEMASWNNISPPYRLFPGQKLRLTAPTKVVARADSRQPVSRTKAPRNHPAAKSQKAPPRVAKPSAAVPRKATSARKATPKTRSAPVAKRQTPVKSGPWAWPADGKLLNYRTPSRLNKGVDIAGARGQAIRAAAPGRVVYVGNGLRGYGLLIILKHNDAFLSAYAHSEKVYVREGDMIKAGQKIADMGSSGTDRVKLHFEIRRRGVPVDPLLYLPKK